MGLKVRQTETGVRLRKSAFTISGACPLQMNVALFAFLFLEIRGKIVENLYLLFIPPLL